MQSHTGFGMGLTPAQSARGVDATYRKRGHRQTAHLTGETCVIGRDVIATTRHLDTNTERLARCIACIRRRIIMGEREFIYQVHIHNIYISIITMAGCQ